MPAYFKVYNCYPSFTSTFTQDGVDRTNPLPNYGGLGDHLQDYFVNHMAETPSGGYGNLVAFLASSKSLTGIMAADLTGMANNLSVKFGITGSTVGHALLDFRGDSWKYIIGDGIIGPSNTSNTAAYTSTVNAAVSILDHFKSKYPTIKWAYAGLPHLPTYTTYAPNAGTSFSWAPSLTNTAGATNNNWDANHITAGNSGEGFFGWSRTPSDLVDFYKTNAISRVESILDASGWACPDINPPLTNTSTFGSMMYSLKDQYYHTRDVVELAVEYANERYLEAFYVMPLVSSMQRSREAHFYDDFGGTFTQSGYAPGVSGQVVAVYSGFTGSSGNASDRDMDLATLSAGMLEPAAREGVYGFIYQDNIPMLVELACTGGTQSTDASQQAVRRARNYLAQTVYGTNDTTLIPWASVASELKSHLSYNIVAPQLRTISESIPVGDDMWRLSFLGGNYAMSGGASDYVSQYNSAFWSGDSSTTTNTGTTPPNCCAQTAQGACCNNGCADNSTASSCAGTFHVGTSCADLASNSACQDNTLVNCCKDGVCGTKTASECAAIQGSTPANCNTCCADSLGSCVQISTCTEQCGTDNETGLPKFRTCTQYKLDTNGCCCVQFGNGTNWCGQIKAIMNCDNRTCPGPCDDQVSVDINGSCCDPGCNDQFPTDGPCLTTKCNCNNFNFVPLGGPNGYFADPNVSLQEKMSVTKDITGLLGIEITYQILASVPPNTSFRQTRTIGNHLEYYSTLSYDASLLYSNFTSNYTATQSNAQRIQLEFGFDRLLLPIAYP